jgi:aminopeptidase
MVDDRIKKLAKVLVEHSIVVKKGSVIKISFGWEAKELAHECYKLILKKGALAITNVIVPGFGYTYYKIAKEEQLKKEPIIAKFEAENIDGFISIGSEYNTREFTNIDSKKIAIRKKIVNPISEIVLKKDNWVGCDFPTHASAQDAGMSLEEFEKYFFTAVNRNWEKEGKRMDVLKRMIDKAKTVRIVTNNTDIKFSIKNRTAIKCYGKRNMPDGEVYVAPVENTVEGFIKYDFPAIASGKEVKDIYLEFKKGKVVNAVSSTHQDFLNSMLDTDEGARYLGEFGIGTNFALDKFIKNTLFDEKMGGTIHLALGMAYKRGGGKNESAIHWDMIKDMKNGGELFFDDKLIQKNGKFTFKF